MRAGPLSNNRVISLLNRFFVPVYAANEDYREGGVQPAEEKAEYNRIFKEAHAAKLSVGTVHVYVLSPAGHPIDSLHVATAAKTDRLIDLLERTVEKLRVREGKAVVPPATQSAPPKCASDSLVLHLTSRSLDGRGAWSDFPVEDWIVLGRDEWAKLLTSSQVQVGDSWEVDKKISARLLTHFYPPTENNDVSKNRFERQSLKATVVSVQKGVARARIEGELKMQHSFYHKEDGKMVEATVVGFIEFEPAPRSIRSLQLVTDQAAYGGGTFGVAVRSLEESGK
jgi:hypothetical protein